MYQKFKTKERVVLNFHETLYFWTQADSLALQVHFGSVKKTQFSKPPLWHEGPEQLSVYMRGFRKLCVRGGLDIKYFTESCTDLPSETIAHKVSNCFSRGSVPVFLKKPITTCDLWGGWDPDSLPRPHSWSGHAWSNNKCVLPCHTHRPTLYFRCGLGLSVKSLKTAARLTFFNLFKDNIHIIWKYIENIFYRQ